MGEVFAELELAPPGGARLRRGLLALVDTGSSYSVVPPVLARSLGLPMVDREELRTAKEEIVTGRIALADLRVEKVPWLRRHLVFVPDEPLRAVTLVDRRTGRRVRPTALLGALTLQEARLVVDFGTHRVSGRPQSVGRPGPGRRRRDPRDRSG